MGTFSASLRAIGDTTPVPATIQLEEGQLTIAAGSTQIGTWPLADIVLEPMPTGYRMSAEGEQILIEMKDVDAFTEALSNGRFKRRFGLRGREKAAKEPNPSSTSRPRSATALAGTASTIRDSGARQPQAAASSTRPSASDATGLVARGLGALDIGIDKAQKRFGPYLPSWLFSRAMFFILFATFIVMLVFPAISSTLLLIVGGGGIALGAVAYTDPMLASRLLPGRTQPPHVLIAGVCILVLGVLIGVIFA